MKITIQYILYHNNNAYDDIVKKKIWFHGMNFLLYSTKSCFINRILVMLMLTKCKERDLILKRKKNFFETRNDKFNKTFSNFPIFVFLSIVAPLLHIHDFFSLVWNEWSMKHASAMNFSLFFHLFLLCQ